MKNFILLFLTLIFTTSLHAAKIRDFPLETQNNLGANDLMLLGGETTNASRKIFVNNLDERWLQAPNDAGTGLNDLWSASKIQSVVDSAGSTLQAIYNNSSQPQIVFDSTNGGLILRDAATPIGTDLFAVQDETGSSNFFSVSTSAVSTVLPLKFIASNPSYTEGQLFYSSLDKTLTFRDDNVDTELSIGHEVLKTVRNATGGLIPNGSVVYISGASAGYPLIQLARADNIATAHVLGMVTHDMPDGTVGKVTLLGDVNGVDTTAFSQGDMLYLSAVSAGVITNVKPAYPNLSIQIGQAVIAGASGRIAVKIDRLFNNYNDKAIFYADSNGGPTNDAANFAYDYTTGKFKTKNQIEIQDNNTDSAYKHLFHKATPTLGIGLVNANDAANYYMQLNVAGGVAAQLSKTGLTLFGGSLMPSDGSLGTLALRSRSDTNTGIYFDGSDNMFMVAGGASKIDVGSTLVKIGDIAGGNTMDVDDSGYTAFKQVYGEMFKSNGGATITITAGGTYYGVTQMGTGIVSGAGYMTYVDNVTADRLTVGASGAGTYKVAFNMSFDGSNSQTIQCKVFKNDIAQNNVHFQRGLGTSPPVGSANATGLIALVANDYIDVRCTSNNSGATLTYYTFNLNAIRVSK